VPKKAVGGLGQMGATAGPRIQAGYMCLYIYLRQTSAVVVGARGVHVLIA